MTEDLSAARLRELLHYDPQTGIWTWLQSPRRNVPVGSHAGYLRLGYRYIQVDERSYPSGQLAFLYMTGAFPAGFVDHENLDRADDRWLNLREASRSENGANRPINRNNTSGFKGVSWDKTANKWSAKIAVDGRKRHLGLFSDPEAAHAAYVAAANEHFGRFARAS